jgi:hypothetical protein
MRVKQNYHLPKRLSLACNLDVQRTRTAARLRSFSPFVDAIQSLVGCQRSGVSRPAGFQTMPLRLMPIGKFWVALIYRRFQYPSKKLNPIQKRSVKLAN